ncbi:sulfatase [Planctomicrobium sp. SH664]|uniref:sulfatase n=1 Tax=Planctomicrobium sp. SH664 TaxID=3448125 RepID=UPI003F5C2BA1
MRSMRWLWQCAMLFTVCTGGWLQAAEPVQHPNIVLILADDLGQRDIGAFNPETFYETPNIDRLATQGMLFTDAYSANPVCSPTRFSVQTGRYPTRVGATNWFSGRRKGKYAPAPLNSFMPLEETTIAEALKTAGYRSALLGKWHLGAKEYAPEVQGYEFYFPQGNPMPDWRWNKLPEDKRPVRSDKLEDFHTLVLADETCKVIRDFAKQPFFVCMAMNAVHTPLIAPSEIVKKYEKKALALEGKAEFAPEEQVWPGDDKRETRILQKHATYAAMVECMDIAVGRVVKQLEELGLAEQTIVCFVSDNGGLSTAEGSPTSNLPWRGGKGWVYEGGIRVPFIVRWPGQVASGSICSTPVCSIDLFPTFLEAAHVSQPSGTEIDGVSLLPLLKGQSIAERDLFWHYPHYSNQGGFPGGAIRRGNLKLVERYEDGRVHLYDLSTDPGEQVDLADQKPAEVAALRDSLHHWYTDVGAKFLAPFKGSPEPWSPSQK